jgi:acetyltransferase-like isoleucine patch superfamily enzyme
MNFTASFCAHITRLASAVRIQLARAHGSSIGHDCELSSGVECAPTFAPARRGSISLGDHCKLETRVILHPYGGSIRLGNYVFIGPHAVVYGHGGVDIGDYTLVAMHCRILSSEHEKPPIGHSIRSCPDLLMPTRIGSDVWLGAGVTVLGGITIGDGCVIGAGSVVTRDIPAGAIAVGLPARVIGRRKQAAG